MRTEKRGLDILGSNKLRRYLQCCVLMVVLLCVDNNGLRAQYLYEIGMGGGVVGYSGELSDNPYTRMGYSANVFFRTNYNSRFSVRYGLSFDSKQGNPDDVEDAFPGSVGSFSREFVSGEAVLEVNFLPYPFQKALPNSSDFTPFSFVGVGVNDFTTFDYAQFFEQITIPFGIGVRWLAGEHWGFQFQFEAVKLFTDSFDDLDSPIWTNTDPEIETGMNCDDWLYSATLMLTYSFGEDIWDCHCPGGFRRKRSRRR